MANTNSPNGFLSFGHRDGSAPTMGLERKFINSSDTNLYFTGDVVAVSSAAPALLAPYIGSSGVPTAYGVFAGCEYYNSNVARVVWSSYFPASVGSSSPVTAYVISDPEMQFVVQASSTPITSTMVGNNVNILTSVSSLGNQTTGISNMTIASTQIGATSSFPFYIVDVYSNFAPPGATGTDNTANYNKAIVAFNYVARRGTIIAST